MKTFAALWIGSAIFFFGATRVLAQSPDATVSAAVQTATPSSVLERTDITQTEQDTRTPLRREYDQMERVSLSWVTPIRFLVATAVDRGIPLNTIVFLFLFPVISALIALTRHVIGLTGFSVYAPAALALALLSLGVATGTGLFVTILVLSAIGKLILPWLKLPYMPRTALLLWFVSIGMFIALVISTYISTTQVTALNVFALLILILLSEDFMEIQSARSVWVAVQRAFETFVLGLMSAVLMGLPIVQLTVLRYPEFVLVGIALGNFLVGKYLGLRLTEWFRFQSIMDTQEE